MKPFKSLHFIAGWLLRLALFSILFKIYYNSFSTLNLANFWFYIGTIMLLNGIIIIAAGFLTNETLTVVSGLIISIISLYKIIISFNGIIDVFLVEHLIPLSIGFYFVTKGNEK